MADPKPVPGQIVLSNDEFSALIIAAVAYGPQINGENRDQRRTRGEETVRTVFATLNRSRCGNPAGEIRRSPRGSIAVREQTTPGGHLGWNVTYLEDGDDEKPTGELIQQWREIHSESWWKRLTTDDFGGTDA